MLGTTPFTRWQAGKSTTEAWEMCPRGDWQIALGIEQGVERSVLIRATVAVVRTALQYTTDPRVPAALDLVDLASRGKATKSEVYAAIRSLEAAHAAIVVPEANDGSALLPLAAQFCVNAAYAACYDVVAPWGFNGGAAEWAARAAVAGARLATVEEAAAKEADVHQNLAALVRRVIEEDDGAAR